MIQTKLVWGQTINEGWAGPGSLPEKWSKISPGTAHVAAKWQTPYLKAECIYLNKNLHEYPHRLQVGNQMVLQSINML